MPETMINPRKRAFPVIMRNSPDRRHLIGNSLGIIGLGFITVSSVVLALFKKKKSKIVNKIRGAAKQNMLYGTPVASQAPSGKLSPERNVGDI